MQLCSPKDFREKICGRLPEYSSLIIRNDKPFGIPQGAPISDLLANAYLIDFDCQIGAYVRERGGFYYRYSDDILLLVPGGEKEGKAARNYVADAIKNFGSQLVIKPQKSSLIQFTMDGNEQAFRFIHGKQRKNGLEYLGFRFDGKKVYLRDSTLSSLFRKITYSARRSASAFVARYPGKDIAFLIENFDVDAFVKRFGRVEGFENNRDYRTWTFWTYARRAAEIFGQKGQPTHRQLRRHRRLIRERIETELSMALVRKLKRGAEQP